MAPDADSPAATAPTADVTGIDRGELYVIIRQAVRDALLGVIGTLLLVGLGLVLLWFGIMLAVSAVNSSLIGALGGVVVALIGFYIAASELDVIPSIGDYL